MKFIAKVFLYSFSTKNHYTFKNIIINNRKVILIFKLGGINNDKEITNKKYKEFSNL